MLNIDIPTLPELQALVAERADACLSIYLRSTPLTQDVGAVRIHFHNLAKEGMAQLAEAAFDKRRLAALAEHLDALGADDAFWRLQATSLAVLATPDGLRTFRLPNHLTPMVLVADRFHLKPLFRALTFPHHAFVLALEESGARLVEMVAEGPPQEVRVPGMPRDAASATGRASVNDRSPSGRIQGSEGQRVLLTQYARQVDAALRPILAGRQTPLILVADDILHGIYPPVNSYPSLAREGVRKSPARMTAAELAEEARPILDRIQAASIDAFRTAFSTRDGQGRATTDLATAARAATFGAIDTLMVDIDEVVPGFVDEDTGAITLVEKDDARAYGVVDEIAGRALLSGARVLGVRRHEIPRQASLAALLRFPM